MEHRIISADHIHILAHGPRRHELRMHHARLLREGCGLPRRVSVSFTTYGNLGRETGPSLAPAVACSRIRRRILFQTPEDDARLNTSFACIHHNAAAHRCCRRPWFMRAARCRLSPHSRAASGGNFNAHLLGIFECLSNGSVSSACIFANGPTADR